MSGQPTPASRKPAGFWLAIAATAVAVATVAAAITVTGGPAAQRAARMDERRVRDLDRLGDAVDRHARVKGALPATLATVVGPGSPLSTFDPVDGSPYGYEVTGSRTYRLCAHFATVGTRADAYEDEWSHGSGRHCFDRKATDNKTAD